MDFTYKKFGILLLVAVLGISAVRLNPFEKHTQNVEPHITAANISVLVNKPLNKSLSLVPNKPEAPSLQTDINSYLHLNPNLSGSVFIEQNNHILYQGGFGYANKASRLPNQPSTTFAIGSISKLFTAVSIMMLQDQHKLTIQDPVSKYIPGFPNGRNIKLYNLMSHTSGIQRLQWKKGDTTPFKLVRQIASKPVKFAAGTKWDYQDDNYIVLGYIVQKVSGENLHTFIQNNILNKVQMKNTGFMTPHDPKPYTATGYAIKHFQVVSPKIPNLYMLYACGDIYSTPYDLSLFDQALYNDKLISPNGVREMLTPRSRSKYGLGLYFNGANAWSNGYVPGFAATHYYFRDKTSLVLLLNEKAQSEQVEHLALNLYKIVRTVMPAYKPAAAAVKS